MNTRPPAVPENDPENDPETGPEADPLRDLNASPLNPLPGLVWLLILAIGGIELVLWAGGRGLAGGPEAVGWRLETIQRFAFSGAIQDWMLETRRAPPGHLLRYLSFGFVHGGPMHAGFVIVLVAALGKYIAEPFGNRAFAVLVVVPPLAGALVFGLVLGGHELGWLFGGMPLVFGLVGALTWWRWRIAEDREARLRAFGVIGTLMAARLGFGLMIEAGHGWIAELAAFAVGFVVSGVVGPGGWRALRARLRAR